MDAQCERESARSNSQDVGLEAATIERVRNSSLVECAGTENVPRLKHPTEAVNPCLWTGMVGERSKAEKPDCKDWWSEEKCECRNE
jgi:hypothetical protein